MSIFVPTRRAEKLSIVELKDTNAGTKGFSIAAWFLTCWITVATLSTLLVAGPLLFTCTTVIVADLFGLEDALCQLIGARYPSELIISPTLWGTVAAVNLLGIVRCIVFSRSQKKKPPQSEVIFYKSPDSGSLCYELRVQGQVRGTGEHFASDLTSIARVEASPNGEGGANVKTRSEIHLRTTLPEASEDDPLSSVYQDGVLLVSSQRHYGYPIESKILRTIGRLRDFLELPEKNEMDQFETNELGMDLLKKSAYREAAKAQIRAQKADRRAKKQARKDAIRAQKARREAST